MNTKETRWIEIEDRSILLNWYRWRDSHTYIGKTETTYRDTYRILLVHLSIVFGKRSNTINYCSILPYTTFCWGSPHYFWKTRDSDTYQTIRIMLAASRHSFKTDSIGCHCLMTIVAIIWSGAGMDQTAMVSQIIQNHWIDWNPLDPCWRMLES